MEKKHLYFICLGIFILTVLIVFIVNLNKEEEKPVVIDTNYELHKDFIKVNRGYEEKNWKIIMCLLIIKNTLIILKTM